MKFSFAQILLDLIYRFLPCKKRYMTESIRRRQRIFKQAQGMLNRQFDIQNLLKLSIIIKLIVNTMFSKQQSLLLLFQRKQVIEPDQDISQTESDLEFRERFDAHLNSTDPWERIFALFQIF